jgi:dTDP-glucose 4,6-dehydratase
MKLIITGCAGFIGSNFTNFYLSKHPKDRIIGYDSLTYAGNIKALSVAIKNPKFKFVKGDITDRKLVGKLFREERPDLIVNFAAESHVDRSIKEPMVTLETNLFGMQVLLDACLEYNKVRFHQISTDEVYGDLTFDSKISKFTEESKLSPSNPYSASKAAADLLVLSYSRTYKLPITISRCSNNYGSNQHIEKFIPLMITKALNNEELPIYGNGKNIRDWIYVDDHCRAIDLILNKGRIGEIYNISGNNEMQNIDVVKSILFELGKSESLIKYVPDRIGHDLRYAVNFSKISSELGWKNEIKFENGIKETILWYVAHKKLDK